MRDQLLVCRSVNQRKAFEFIPANRLSSGQRMGGVTHQPEPVLDQFLVVQAVVMTDLAAYP
ncbi:Uncharacterised protein [Mycobacteroides abscessus subsp. abscessus]|nr:Uncharacterised protein [Mycobacteroides abscessus subsp. abscessus]